MARKRTMTVIYIAGGMIIVTVAAILVFLFAQVEDWSRDLTTNFAETKNDAADERLRPIEAALPTEELARRVETAAKSLSNWRLEGRKELDGNVELHFVRTTPVLRFRDDIRVRVEPAGGGALLDGPEPIARRQGRLGTESAQSAGAAGRRAGRDAIIRAYGGRMAIVAGMGVVFGLWARAC